MTSKVLAIDETLVTPLPMEFLCHGLGPCVGVFIWDRQKKIFAGAHLAWQAKCCDTTHPLLDNMLRQMQAAGCCLETLRAKITGGATLRYQSPSIGEMNSAAIWNYLIRHQVYIAAHDTGGKQPRKARFSCDSGWLQITYCNNQTRTI